MKERKPVKDNEVRSNKVRGNDTAEHETTITDDGSQPPPRPEGEALNEYLAQAVAAYNARTYELVSHPATPPDQPYKFLYPFEIKDADIFFGRDAASEAFHQTVLKDRLTVLHARSGTGKTSLLNAGLSPRLIREGRLPVYARAYKDLTLAIKQAIAPPSLLGPWPEPLSKLTLHQFLGQTCAHLGQTQEMVVILDQLEEFFIFWREWDHRQRFIDALADCYDDQSLPVRFTLALRKDYYSDLATFQRRLPHIFHNEYYLQAMTRQEAQAAITGPVTRLGRPVAYEPALLDTLLDDLAGAEGIELPHLQIICTQLYEALPQGETTVTLASYEKLGRAGGALDRYLKGMLDNLPGKQGSIAREVLKELVSSEATRRVLSHAMLKARVEAGKDGLDGVLARLVNARLLRRDEVAGETLYEIAHEYPIEEIRKWIDHADLEFKQAEELLMREMANWRTHGTLIPKHRLALLHAQRERLRGVDDEVWECLLRSALQTDFAVEDWAELAGEVGERFLLSVLNDPDARVRQGCIKVLGQRGDPRAVEPLIAALRDKDGSVRQATAEALGKMRDLRAVEPLTAALQDEDIAVCQAATSGLGAIWGLPGLSRLADESSSVRFWAADALGNLGDPRAVEPLIAALRNENKDGVVRCAAVRALGNLGDPRAVEPLIAALRDEDIAVRRAAARALWKLGDSRGAELFVVALRDEDITVRRTAAEALGMIGDPQAVEPLIAALQDKDWRVRQAAASALGKLGNSHAVEPLIAALQDKDWRVRQAAASALRNLGDSQAVEPLTAALQDKDWRVRQAAASTLGNLDDPRAVEPLTAALQDENWLIRQVAAGALGNLGDRRAVEPLIAALQDWHIDLNRAVAGVLGELGDRYALEPLIATLWDRYSDVCCAAAGALGKLGDSRAVEPLIATLQNEDSSVREAAAEALEKIGTPEALAALE